MSMVDFEKKLKEQLDDGITKAVRGINIDYIEFKMSPWEIENLLDFLDRNVLFANYNQVLLVHLFMHKMREALNEYERNPNKIDA